MARTKTISDERILTVAREVFIEQGPTATTAEIARQAGISEGSIFRRWSTKRELFKAAMGLPDLRPLESSLRARVGRGDVRENLEAICLEILDVLVEVVPVHMLVLASGVDPSVDWADETDPPPLQTMRTLIHFFDKERKLGRIRNCDPEIVARMLLGALHHFAFAEIAHLNDRLPMATESYVRGVVDALLEGIETPKESAG